MSTLKLYLFGTPRIEIDEQPVHLERQKAAALLAYLAITGRAHAREWLATLLWRDTDSSRVQLRIVLGVLRKALGEEGLAINRDDIALSGQHQWSDVDVFRTLSATVLQGSNPLRRQDFDTLMTLYRYNFMAGFSLRDAPEFDAWQRLEEQELRLIFEQALSRYAHHWSRMGDFATALVASRRLATLDPYNEEARRLLMKLYTWTNQRSLAIQEYRQLKSTLWDEISVEPEAKTTALFQDIQAERTIQFRELSENAPYQWISTKLPVMGALYGRDDAINALTELFNKGARLVTITGPGGIGKTHVALQVAQGLRTLFADGVYFLQLQVESSAEFLVSALLELLGLHPLPMVGAQETLITFLHEKRLLLILDNAHWLQDGQSIIQHLLESAPELGILATSYDPLYFKLEHRYTLHGLEAAASSAAIQLFVQSAQRVAPSFRPDAENLRAILQICRRVDGMPLAIILASVWCDVLSVPEIAQEIEGNYDFLRITHHDLPERHRSLRSVFETAWARLNADEQSTLMRLAIFQGSFSRAAAEIVTQTRLSHLQVLVIKSLVNHQAAQQRYTLHDIYRQYAYEKLSANEAQALRSAHTQYYSQFLASRVALVKGTLERSQERDRQWQEIDLELSNIRHAWTTLLEVGDFDTLNHMMEPWRLTLAARGLWEQGLLLFDHARAVTAQALAATPASPVARLAYAKSHTRLYRESADTEALLVNALALARTAEDADEVANIHGEIGWYYLMRRQYAAAQIYFFEALHHHQARHEYYYISLVLRGLTYAALRLSDRAQAHIYMQESLRLRIHIGDAIRDYETLALRGELALMTGDLAAAHKEMRAVETYFKTNFNNPLMAVYRAFALGWVLAFMGDRPAATRFADQVQQITSDPAQCTAWGVRIMVALGADEPAFDEALPEMLAMHMDNIPFWHSTLNPDLYFLCGFSLFLGWVACQKTAAARAQLAWLDRQGYFGHSDMLIWIVPGALVLAAQLGHDAEARRLAHFYQTSATQQHGWTRSWRALQTAVVAFGGEEAEAFSVEAVATVLRHLAG